MVDYNQFEGYYVERNNQGSKAQTQNCPFYTLTLDKVNFAKRVGRWARAEEEK